MVERDSQAGTKSYLSKNELVTDYVQTCTARGWGISLQVLELFENPS